MSLLGMVRVVRVGLLTKEWPPDVYGGAVLLSRTRHELGVLVNAGKQTSDAPHGTLVSAVSISGANRSQSSSRSFELKSFGMPYSPFDF